MTPDHSQRRRGLVRAALGLGVAALLALWKPVVGAVAAGLALLLLAVALASPGGLYPRLERGIAAFARAAATVVSHAALGTLHLLVFTPLGLVLRATGQLRIEREPDPDAPSYWRPADGGGRGGSGHERQF